MCNPPPTGGGSNFRGARLQQNLGSGLGATAQADQLDRAMEACLDEAISGEDVG